MAIRAQVCRLAIAAAIVTSCRARTIEPLTLDGNLLTVDNRTAQSWNGVEIWLNTYDRATTSSIPAGGRFQAPLDYFVAGFGQRFDVRRALVTDLRLTARLPDGQPIEVKKAFAAQGLRGLAGALGGKR